MLQAKLPEYHSMQPNTDNGVPQMHEQSQTQQVLCPLNMDPYTQLPDPGCPNVGMGLEHNNQNTLSSVTNL